MKTLKKINNFRESDAPKGENLEVLHIMNLVSLVAFENFVWLLMIHKLSFAIIVTLLTKQYWSNS